MVQAVYLPTSAWLAMMMVEENITTTFIIILLTHDESLLSTSVSSDFTIVLSAYM